MSIFSWKKTEKRSVENPQVPISSSNIVAFLTGSSQSSAGVTVNEETALSVPSIWGAVNFLASTIASLPLKIYQKTDDGREESTGKLSYLLHDAVNEEMTSYKWRKYVMQCALLKGRGLTFIERTKGGEIVGLWPINPDAVTIKRQNGRIQYTYKAEKTAVYSASDVIDIAFMLPSDMAVSSVAPIHKLRDAIGLAIALQGYATKYFSQGGVPPLVLQGPAMSPAAAARASDDIKAAIRKAAKGGDKAFVIPEGYELKPVGGNPEDSQLEASRRFQLEEIARIYGLPPVFLQDLTRATFNNVEQQDLNLVKHTLRPWLDAWESELNLKLFGFGSTSGKYAEFSLDALLRGDFKNRMDGYATGIQNGILKPDEARKLENRPPAEGGDRLYLQQNMAEMKDLTQSGGTDDGSD